MINGERVGVGVVTCTRKDMFEKLVTSLKPCDGIIDRIVVFEDTFKDKTFQSEFYSFGSLDDWKCSHREVASHGNAGVGVAKNECLRDLLYEGYDHIFLIEDDMLIKDPKVFEKYIEASKVSGIQHMMFAYHGPANKNNVSKGTPTPRLVIKYNDDVSISLNRHCVGSFCYYTRKSLEDCGLIDEKFKNAFDHVSHSYELALKGYSTPYWWWADLEKSYDYIDEQACSEESSTIKTPERLQEWSDNIQISMSYFKEKFGVMPFGQDCVPDTSEREVLQFVKSLK